MSRDPRNEKEQALEDLLDLVARLIARAHLRQAETADRANTGAEQGQEGRRGSRTGPTPPDATS